MAETIQVKKFVSESEIDEKRRKRQEEWEKVRQPHQPLEAPEVVETRSLYEQLEAQKEQKQLDYEEQHRMKNQVRVLDKDETDFLEYVSERQVELEKAKNLEEHDVLQELHNSIAARHNVTELSATQLSERSNDKVSGPSAKKRTSQAELLVGAVKRKKSSDVSESVAESVQSTEASSTGGKFSDTVVINSNANALPGSNIARVVGVLPGLGVYTDSEDSDTSSSDSDIDTDLLRHNQISQKMNHDTGGSNCASNTGRRH